MKIKNYPVNSIVRVEEHRPIIVITHDEYTFSAYYGV